jgi:hypothetical protein
MPHQQLDALSADVPAVVPNARSFSWSALRPITLPIEARIVILALSFRLLGAAVGFVGNVTIPDYQNQGFTVMERAKVRLCHV